MTGAEELTTTGEQQIPRSARDDNSVEVRSVVEWSLLGISSEAARPQLLRIAI